MLIIKSIKIITMMFRKATEKEMFCVFVLFVLFVFLCVFRFFACVCLFVFSTFFFELFMFCVIFRPFNYRVFSCFACPD